MNKLDPITFPLQGSRLIEASAGTGKTFTISLLYLRLVLGHRSPDRRDARPLTPPEILVSTFTDAAVAELRDRIRSRLQQAAWLFAGTRTPAQVDPPLRNLYEEFSEAERAQGAFLLQRAAEWMDEAAIFTIHGFCQRMLREHAFHSGALFEQELVTDLGPVIGDAIRDFWRTHGYPLARTDERLAQQFAWLVETPGKLKDQIRGLINRDGSPLAIGETTAASSADLPAPADLLGRLAQDQQRAEAAEGHARQAWLADAGALHALWHGARDGLNKTSHPEKETAEGLEAWLGQIDTWAAGEGQLGDTDRRKLATPKTKKGHEPPVHPALDAIADWKRALEGLDRQAKEIKPLIQGFAALWIRERIAHLLAARRAMGFDDMLIQMREAVDPTRNPNACGMVEAVRAQYPVALIDEFQDTDPLQYAIFSAIYPLGEEPSDSDESAIVLIGDPKQAIYSFRGADIHSYLTARRATEGRHASLPYNFRSTEALVSAVNRLFSLADQHPDGAFRFPAQGEGEDGQSPLPFQPVEAKGHSRRLVDERRDGDVPALTLWASPPEEQWTSGVFREQLAIRTAGEIAAMLNAGQAGTCGFETDDGQRQGVQPRDVAVLVRKQEEGKLMRRVLADFGVPAVFLSERSSVFDSTEAADMLIWLEALAEPSRSDRIRQAIATASMALPLDELEACLRDETRFDAICQRFHEWHHTWQSQGVLAAIMGLLHHFAIPARLLQADERQNHRGERRLTNLLHLAEWLQQTDQDVDGETALIHRLHLAVTEGAAEQEIRLEQDSAMVRIVTIHGSKGLQYPVVFLPFIALLGTETAKSGEPTRRHRDDGTVWEMAPDKDATEFAAQEAIAEYIRLLYVAMTRAESACVLGAGPVKFGRAKAFNPGKTAFGQFLGFQPDETCERPAYLDKLARWAEHPAIVIETVPEPRDPGIHRFTPPPEPELLGPRQPHFGAFEPWWISSFSALTASVGHPTPLPAPEAARDEVRLETQNAPENAASAAPPTSRSAPEGIHALPRGAQIGTLLHDLIEAIADEGFSQYAGQPEKIRRLLAHRAHPGLRALDDDQVEVVAALLDTLLSTRWQMPGDRGQLALAEQSRYQAEMEFWFAVEGADLGRLDRLVREHVAPGRDRPALSGHAINGMLKGFIDLTVEHEGRYYLIDWKSNWLGPEQAAYTPEALEHAMLDSRYDLQFVLYLVALHRHLSDRLPDYDYDRHVGGAAYVFLRGIHPAADEAPNNAGIYTCRPPRELIEALDTLFTGNEEAVA